MSEVQKPSPEEAFREATAVRFKAREIWRIASGDDPKEPIKEAYEHAFNYFSNLKREFEDRPELYDLHIENFNIRAQLEQAVGEDNYTDLMSEYGYVWSDLREEVEKMVVPDLGGSPDDLKSCLHEAVCNNEKMQAVFSQFSESSALFASLIDNGVELNYQLELFEREEQRRQFASLS